MRRIVVAAMLAVSVLSALPAWAEAPQDFVDRIAAAYQAPNRFDALRELFYFDGVDAATLWLYEDSIIRKSLSRHERPAIALEPLPEEFDAVNVLNGYEYRPNLDVLGFVVLDGSTKVPYGEHDGRLYLTAMVRKPAALEGPPEQDLRVKVEGRGTSAVRFTGYCDIMQSNGKTRRMTLKDDGRGEQTIAVRARFIEACEVTNLSEKGMLILRLLEGENTTFEARIHSPEKTITFIR